MDGKRKIKLILIPAFLASFFLCSCSFILKAGPEDTDEETDADEDVSGDDPATDDGEMSDCGNGVVEEGEECDDGNTDEDDGCTTRCRFTCHNNGECSDGSDCNGEETCNPDSHTCETGDPMADGFVCEDNPRSICLDGECTESTCGDEFVDTGAGESCDPPEEGVCSDTCHTLCLVNEDCDDDGNMCNGNEICNTITGECTHVNPMEDGAECGEDPRRICIGGTCQESICGDEFVDEVEFEDCDDGNDVDGDGCDSCTYSCHNNAECDDGHDCTTHGCDLYRHICFVFLKEDGVTCRESAGDCDEPEVCDGASMDCPPDGFKPGDVLCRSATKVCDAEEFCTGDSAGCPPDAFSPSSTVCRESTAACDPAEYCTGVSADCPDDVYNCTCTIPSHCPDDGNMCNGEEYCDTDSGHCARRNMPPDGTECVESPRRICLNEICVPSVCGDGFPDTGGSEECDDGNDITGDGCEGDCTYSCHGDEECDDGHDCTSDACSPTLHKCIHTIMSGGDPCRPAADVCDAPEYCNSSDLDCPYDEFEPSTTVCRTSGITDTCNPDEYCTGFSVECPPDYWLCWLDADGGLGHTCGIKTDGDRLFCWGAGDHGQLGNGSNGDELYPVEIGLESSWSAVAAGGSHSCAISSENSTLLCWGNNSDGQLGIGLPGDQNMPMEVSENPGWSAVSAGVHHTCGILDTAVWCWGKNSEGQLGNGTYDSSDIPVQIYDTGEEKTWLDVSCGSKHTCAVTDGREIYCWGNNDSGQLGNGTNTPSPVPVEIHSIVGSFWHYVACGHRHSCGIKGNLLVRNAYCWGENGNHQLGDGTTTDSSVPVLVGSGSGITLTDIITAIEAGEAHTCMRGDSGAIYCWGSNAGGQLGIGSREEQGTPVALSGSDWDFIATGASHTCSIVIDGLLFCWGSNEKGQVGDGTIIDRVLPKQVLR